MEKICHIFLSIVLQMVGGHDAGWWIANSQTGTLQNTAAQSSLWYCPCSVFVFLIILFFPQRSFAPCVATLHSVLMPVQQPQYRAYLDNPMASNEGPGNKEGWHRADHQSMPGDWDQDQGQQTGIRRKTPTWSKAPRGKPIFSPQCTTPVTSQKHACASVKFSI